MTNFSGYEVFVGPDRRLTFEGQEILQRQDERIAALEALLADISAVTAPTGGGTVDAQARTAISAIIAAAS